MPKRLFSLLFILQFTWKIWKYPNRC